MKSALAALLIWSTCVGVVSARTYDSVPFPQGETPRIVLNPSLPTKKMLPQQSAPIPDANFVMIQTKGGSILLGPLLGGANIKAKTAALASKSKASDYIGTDVAAIAAQSLARIGIAAGPEEGAYVLRPFSFVQQCDDGKLRISIAYDVTGPGPKNPWIGRYSYHLPTAIPDAQFIEPSPEQVEQFVSEMSTGAEALTALVERDIGGALPATGRKVNFGSLNLMGNKLGGMGIYTPAEKLFVKDTQLVEEKDGYVIVRINGNPNMTGMFGGLSFGVHQMARDQVHTLTE